MPHPDPFFRDDVLYVRASADVAALRARFPERKLYRMLFRRQGAPIALQPIDP
jgi:hypothetical protein